MPHLSLKFLPYTLFAIECELLYKVKPASKRVGLFCGIGLFLSTHSRMNPEPILTKVVPSPHHCINPDAQTHDQREITP